MNATGATEHRSDPAQNHRRAEAYFESAQAMFERMAEAPEAVIVQTLQIADFRICVRASKSMAGALHSATSHLRIANTPQADLTISAWDSAMTGTPPLVPGWPLDAYGRHGFIDGFNDNRFHTALQTDPVIFRMIDMAKGQALYWTPSAAEFPYWEFGAPLRPLLHEWLRRKGFLAVHGGAVGFEDGGVLLAGPGGSGKSNVALACLASDLLYASDDFCCVSRADGWTVHSLYSTGKMAAGDIARHPHLTDARFDLGRFENEKALFFLNDGFGRKLVRNMPLRAIVLPRVVGQGASELVESTPAEAQRAIATSTIELSRWTARDTFRDVAEMVRSLPCYELRVGASLSEIPGMLAGLLRRLG